MPSDTLSKSISAGQWALVSTILQRVLGLGTLLILARLLSPATFGIVALVAIVPTFISGITIFGFETPAIQKGNFEKYMNVIWTVYICRGIAIFAITFLIAPLLASFFHIEYAIWALRLAGLPVLIQSFESMGQMYFFSNLDFKKVFIRDISSALPYSISTIIFASLLHSFWAPFLGNIVGAFGITIATYLLHPYKHKLDFKFSKLEELRGFTQWLFAQEIIQQATLTLQNTLIGRYTSPTDLGLFTKAQSLADGPVAPLMSAINKVSFNSYVKVQDSMAHITEGLNKTFDLLAALALPYLVVILLFGTTIVHLLLGTAWLGMSPFLKILVIESTLDSLISGIVSPLFNAIGMPQVQFYNGIPRLVIIWVGFIFLIPLFGIWGAVATMLAGALVTSAVIIYRLLTIIKLDFAKIWQSSVVTAIACIVPIPLAKVLLTVGFFNTIFGYLTLLTICAALYALIIIGIGRLYRKGPYKTLELIARSIVNGRLKINRFNFIFLYQDAEGVL